MATSTTGDFTTAPSTLGNIGLLAIRLGIGATMLHRPAMAERPGARPNYVVLLRITVIVFVLLALVLVHLTSRWGVGWRLITFTYQANLLAAGFSAWTLISARAGTRAGLRGAVVVYVVVAGIIWNLFLTEESMGYTPANILLHMLVPMLVIAEAVLTDDAQPRLRWSHPPIWLIYPAIYLVFAVLILNHSGRRVPYYFLDTDRIGTVGLTLNVCLLAAMFLGVGYGVVLLNRVRTQAPTESTVVANG